MAKAGRQLELSAARKPMGHGGWRPGAGRPRKAGTCSHQTRAKLDARTPQHVTLRMAAGVPSVRRDRTVRVMREVIAAAHRDDFRVVEFTVLSNHLHLIVEANDERALARGMHDLEIRIAKRVNALMARSGRFFDGRYHARSLRSPREVRNAIRYVLLNGRHHAAQSGERLAPGWIDPWSSAPWFDGWRNPPRHPPPWLRELQRRPPPTAPPRSWLLTTGWRRHGLIGVDELSARDAISAARGRPSR